MTVLGVVSGIMINIGLVAPFIDAAKRDWRIIGISFRFLSIDFAGALFSLLSLCFQATIDRSAAGSYIAVMALEIGICIIQCSWICRKWAILKEARKLGKSFDEYTGQDTSAEEKSKQQFVRPKHGPRESRRPFSISAFFAAMNRRHGENNSREKVKTTDIEGTRGDDKFHANVAVENLEPEPSQLLPSTYLPRDQDVLGDSKAKLSGQ
jgi:hypothetical protein